MNIAFYKVSMGLQIIFITKCMSLFLIADIRALSSVHQSVVCFLLNQIYPPVRY